MGKRTAKRKEAAGGRSRSEMSPGNFVRGCIIGGQYLISGIPLLSNNLHGAILKYYTETVLYLKRNFQTLIYCGRVRERERERERQREREREERERRERECVCVCLTAALIRSIIHPQIIGE